ncbi:MAG TPA: hypothetical protein DCE41_01740 [Cytophagales bacterium]|nr:hypothetical protein [Cytophagales bacterium]
MPWLMDGEAPLSVTAITQTIKPDIYPEVEDEATILLTYPEAQAIVQASWNWPYNRKDMEVYGKSSAVTAKEWTQFGSYSAEQKWEYEELAPLSAPYHDPFAYFAAVVREEIAYDPKGLSSLENNLIVMQILEAAKQSVATGTTVPLKTP